MSVTSTPIFPQTINTSVTQFTSSYSIDTVTTVYTGGSNGSKVEMLLATNTDSANSQTVLVYIVISATNYLIGAVSLPLSSGNTTAAPTVNILSNIVGLPKDSNGNPYIYLKNGAVLSCSVHVQPASTKVINFVAHGGDY